ncbi:unnamed protein product, partial [Sphacelaria rigidula]
TVGAPALPLLYFVFSCVVFRLPTWRVQTPPLCALHARLFRLFIVYPSVVVVLSSIPGKMSSRASATLDARTLRRLRRERTRAIALAPPPSSSSHPSCLSVTTAPVMIPIYSVVNASHQIESSLYRDSPASLHIFPHELLVHHHIPTLFYHHRHCISVHPFATLTPLHVPPAFYSSVANVDRLLLSQICSPCSTFFLCPAWVLTVHHPT